MIDTRSVVQFTEYVSDRPKDQARADTYLIDPAHVGLVAERERYTSLLVQGRWIHVAGSTEEVLRKLNLHSVGR